MKKKKRAEVQADEHNDEAGTKPAAEDSDSKSSREEQYRFPVAGLGASAGGLEALKAFFAQVPEKDGIAYIVVMHMHPQQPSVLPDLLQRVCKIPVRFAEDGETVRPDRVYIAPPDKEMNIYKGEVHLLELIDKREVLPIDYFLRSLARDLREMAVGVILSGTGTDGTLGVKEIKNNEGIVLVQTVETAQYDGMPTSALERAVVDRTLAPGEMPALIREYFENLRFPEVEQKSETDEEKSWMHRIFAILVAQVGHDFSLYKRSTTRRRILRRMGINKIEEPETYITFLRENPDEIDKLFQELLIGVTHFFRDVESFETLKEQVIPKLIEEAEEDSELRVWVPGCATGEEVYSLAMVIQEYLDEHPKRIHLQYFGTDIDRQAIEKARGGLYTSGISADVGRERLKRFFVQEGDFYRIRKDTREKIIFSLQDVIKDPPFLRIDLLCCRNLLIYLDGEVQDRILPLFHYALRRNGVLMLGSSESLGKFSHLYQPVNSKWKIFRRREVPQSVRGAIQFPTGITSEAPKKDEEPAPQGKQRRDYASLTKEAVLEHAAPTSVLVDREGAILYVQGRSGRYLEPPSGPPSHNILDMTREGLRFELSTALRTASESGEHVLRRKVGVKTNGDVQMVNIHVRPLRRPKELEGTFLIFFEDVESPDTEAPEAESDDEGEARWDRKVKDLERELQDTRESHQTTIEELESANEELKSTNEELQSSNEELQSTNEELESSKEELQSLNEELQTVNSELQNKVEELSAAHDDMNNLLNGLDIAALFVDNDLRIQRYTTEASSIVKLIASDKGRPLSDMGTRLDYPQLFDDIREVLDSLIPKEDEVRSVDGTWYLMRILPYRTEDNRIEGAVLTFLNIDEQKRAQGELSRLNEEKEQDRLLLRRVFDMMSGPLAVLDKNGSLIIANDSFNELMGIASEEVEGLDILGLDNKLLAETGLRALLQDALREGRDFQTDRFPVRQGGTESTYRIEGSIVKSREGEPYRILLAFDRIQDL